MLSGRGTGGFDEGEKEGDESGFYLSAHGILKEESGENGGRGEEAEAAERRWRELPELGDEDGK